MDSYNPFRPKQTCGLRCYVDTGFKETYHVCTEFHRTSGGVLDKVTDFVNFERFENPYREYLVNTCMCIVGICVLYSLQFMVEDHQKLWDELCKSCDILGKAVVLTVRHFLESVRNLFNVVVYCIKVAIVILRVAMRWSLFLLFLQVHVSGKKMELLTTAAIYFCNMIKLVVFFVKVTTGFDVCAEFFSFFRGEQVLNDWRRAKRIKTFFEIEKKDQNKQPEEPVS